MIAEWFPGRLRELRERAGLSRKEVAAAADMAPGTIASFELGALPNWRAVVALCQAIGCRPDEFLVQPKPRPKDLGGRRKRHPAVRR